MVSNRSIHVKCDSFFTRNAFISKDKLKVIVGDYNIDSEDEAEHVQFDIEKVIVHYNYKPTESHANDIAVIKLNGTIDFNENIQPICLVQPGKVDINLLKLLNKMCAFNI